MNVYHIDLEKEGAPHVAAPSFYKFHIIALEYKVYTLR